jgi:hypothetical protein
MPTDRILLFQLFLESGVDILVPETGLVLEVLSFVGNCNCGYFLYKNVKVFSVSDMSSGA